MPATYRNYIPREQTRPRKASVRHRATGKLRFSWFFEIFVTLGFQVVELSSPLAPSTANARSPRLVETILRRVLDTRLSTIWKINCWIFWYSKKCGRFFLFSESWLGTIYLAGVLLERIPPLQIIFKAPTSSPRPRITLREQLPKGKMLYESLLTLRGSVALSAKSL